MSQFDPNAAALPNSGIFGFPYSIKESELVLISVPWEVTSSYGSGQKKAPKAILEASRFIDLFDKELGNFFNRGIALSDELESLAIIDEEAQPLAKKIIEAAGRIEKSDELKSCAKKVDDFCSQMNQAVYKSVHNHLKNGKKIGLIGGNHSSPLGCILAHINKYPEMAVLQLDAHSDLIERFEGFEYSHASIMYNVLEKTDLKSLVQVGIRGYCNEEFDYINNNKNRINVFYDFDMNRKLFSGVTWDKISDEIIDSLPHQIYISFDIDALDRSLCPNTGTPVPGGLNFQQINHLLYKLVKSGRQIVGFDLVEVVPETQNDWDANAASQLLFKLCGYLLNSSS